MPARKLLRSWLVPADMLLARGAVFPFFRRDGSVPRVMITFPKSSRILILPQGTGTFRVGKGGLVSIDARIRKQPDVDENVRHELAGLWHYDPWWVLRQERFVGHPAVSHLEATNCAKRLPADVEEVEFDERLSRIVSVRRGGRCLPFSAELLPFPTEERPPRPARAGGWRLAPRWNKRPATRR